MTAHPSGSGFDIGHLCLTCGNHGPVCKPGHDVQRVHRLDIAGLWRRHNERLSVARVNEARMLGERDAA